MAIPTGQTSLILASASPRRRELLSSLGLVLTVDPAEIDETPEPQEAPVGYVLRVAQEKAATTASRHPAGLVLAADTSVVVENAILGKPKDADDAVQMLRRLSGRTHRVISAVAVAGRTQGTRVVETTVTFRPLRDPEVRWYVQTGEPMDKAGAYAIQGRGGAFVQRIDGSHSNVIGLPLVETLELLAESGLALPWSQP